MKYPSIRTLGFIGIIGAPWIFIDFINNGLYDRFGLTSWSGVRGFLFITGWMCSIIGLYKLKAMGTKRWQKMIMIFQILFLILANCWNIIEIIAPGAPLLDSVFNLAWPLAGVFMLVTGIVIFQAKQLTGWKRYIPVLAGLWFPQTIVLTVLHAISLPALVFTGIYATIVFMLLALTLLIDIKQETAKRRIKLGTS